MSDGEGVWQMRVLHDSVEKTMSSLRRMKFDVRIPHMHACYAHERRRPSLAALECMLACCMCCAQRCFPRVLAAHTSGRVLAQVVQCLLLCAGAL